MTIYSISLITGRIYIAKRLQYSSRIFFSRIVISPIIYLETLIRPRSSTTFSAQLTACFCDLDGASFQNRARCFVCWLYVTKLGLMACSSAREDSLSPARRHGVFGYTTGSVGSARQFTKTRSRQAVFPSRWTGRAIGILENTVSSSQLIYTVSTAYREIPLPLLPAAINEVDGLRHWNDNSPPSHSGGNDRFCARLKTDISAFNSGLRGRTRSCLTFLERGRRDESKIVRHDLRWPWRPELNAEMSVFNLAQKRSFPPLCSPYPRALYLFTALGLIGARRG
jgi:hypothetical protein